MQPSASCSLLLLPVLMHAWLSCWLADNKGLSAPTELSYLTKTLSLQWLDELLPDDAHEQCRGRVTVVVTTLPDMAQVGWGWERGQAGMGWGLGWFWWEASRWCVHRGWDVWRGAERAGPAAPASSTAAASRHRSQGRLCQLASKLAIPCNQPLGGHQ